MASACLSKLLACCFCLFVLVHAMDDGAAAAAAASASASASASGMQSGELLALFEVMGALLQDPSWAQLHPRPCTDTPWPGVQCEMVVLEPPLQQQQDPHLHVTELHIGPDVASPPCKHSAILSPALLQLPYLKRLSLFSCFLAEDTVPLPPSLFTNASALEQLVIKSNPGLSGTIPPALGALHSLRVLCLSQNGLHGAIPKELGSLVRLEQLDLSYNNLSGPIPVELGGLSSLTIFDLSWNGLQGEIPPSIGDLWRLQKLDLSYNKISGRIPAAVGRLERLVLLDLSHNSLAGPVPDELSGLRRVQYFLMESNPIGTTIPSFLKAVKSLVVLGLSDCGLSGHVPTFLGGLSNLTSLSLDRNKLDGTIPSTLETIPNLDQLNLSQNLLGGALSFSEEFVSRLGRRLDVRDNQGLCMNPPSHQINTLPFYLQAPPCPTTASSSSNRTPETNETMKSNSDGMRSNYGTLFGCLVVLVAVATSPGV